MRIHEYLEIVEKPGGKKILCSRCGHELCGAGENYKEHATLRERDVRDLPRMTPTSGDPLFGVYLEYSCPGCGVLLDVDFFCPELDAEQEKRRWDIHLRA